MGAQPYCISSPPLSSSGGEESSWSWFWILLSGGQIGARICGSLQSVERSVWQSVCVLTENSELSQRLCCEDPVVLAQGPDLTGPGEERRDNLTLISPFWGTQTRQLAFRNQGSRVSKNEVYQLIRNTRKKTFRGNVSVYKVNLKEARRHEFFNQF